MNTPGEAETAYYVYAVAQARNGNRGEASPSVDLGCSPVYGLRYRDLIAVVGPVSLAEFGPEVLEANLRDLAWVSAKVLGHQEVLVRLLGRHTLIPFKFGTLFRSEDAVREMLDRHCQRFYENLARLEGAAEWGVKLYYDRRALVERVLETSETLRPLRERISRASEGAAHFLRKKLDQAAEQEAAQVKDACVRESHGRLASHAREAVANPLLAPEVHRHGMEMIFNGAYLVADGSLQEFRETLASLDEAYRSQGICYELTGPWPPFSFVAEETNAIQ